MAHSVLLVDDDACVLSGLARALHNQPYHLYTAKSAEEAIWILKTHDVDVVVSDENMPGMSGVELLTWVAAHRSEVARIVLTGHAAAATVIHAINEGAVYHFFTKPCDEVQLAITIRKAIEHKDLRRENGRLLELSRQQVRELARLNQDREFQARIIGADLQKPLEEIAAACHGLETRYAHLLDAEAQGLIASVREAADEVQHLTDGLLEHSRPHGVVCR